MINHEPMRLRLGRWSTNSWATSEVSLEHKPKQDRVQQN